jgi:hypothetical protein
MFGLNWQKWLCFMPVRNAESPCGLLAEGLG